MDIMSLMMAIHWPAAFYLCSAISVAILQPLASPFNDICPLGVKDKIQTLLSFGKTLDVEKNPNKKWMKYLIVPKSWFRHFYVFSSSIGVMSSVMVCGVIIPPLSLHTLLDVITTPHRVYADNGVLSVLSVLLLSTQCCARLYECYYVSVFSSKGSMNLLHYAVGFLHYAGAYATLLEGTPALAVPGGAAWQCGWVAWRGVVATLLFAVAFLIQRHSMRHLASLRTGKSPAGGGGSRYHVPVSGGFRWVSCPHMTAEVSMYWALFALQPTGPTAAMAVFVTVNQVQVALSNHRWYRATFPRYPAARRAILPHLV